MSALAIDLGGTKLASALFSSTGDIVSRNTIALDGRAGAEVGVLVKDEVKKYRDSEGGSLQSIGVSVPGISRRKSGTVWAPNIPGWEDYPLMREIGEVADGASIEMDSDRACSILGEQWKGCARGCKDAIYMAVGTGIGAGILVNGNIVRGADDIAGAVGWLALMKPFENKYISCGCYEYYASGDGIARYARELLAQDGAYSGMLQDRSDSLTALQVFEAYDRDDPVALKVVQECIELWGMAAANFISIFNPERIIFGGGVFGPAAKFIPAIQSEAKKWAQPVSFTKVTFEPSALGGNAAVFGAGFLALSHVTPRPA